MLDFIFNCICKKIRTINFKINSLELYEKMCAFTINLYLLQNLSNNYILFNGKLMHAHTPLIQTLNNNLTKR